jgi:hypothetical protein
MMNIQKKISEAFVVFGFSFPAAVAVLVSWGVRIAARDWAVDAGAFVSAGVGAVAVSFWVGKPEMA